MKKRRRIRPLGVVLIAVFVASVALLGVGAAKLIRVDSTLDGGARKVQRMLDGAKQGDMRLDEPSKTFDVDGHPALGVLTFGEDARTSVPVYAGTADEVLELGIGQADGTAALNTPGNAVLFGHRDSAFRRLETTAEGDRLTVETSAGKAQYSVLRAYVTDPDDPYIYAQTETAVLTMVTCYPFRFVGPAPQRYVVVAEQVS